MRILTGMQASGNPHIGNYFGMMKPSVELQNEGKHDCFYFVADLHAFTTCKEPKLFQENQRNVVLDWLAVGIDPDKSFFYRQSDIAAHTELTWYLLCQTPIGLLERGHSFKDKQTHGLETNAGLFTYPVLMAADILLYDAEVIPVGKDQKQHVEMARDIAQKFNHIYGDTFVLPEPQIKEDIQTIPGLDGKKMSKSYGNTIEIFGDEKVMKKKIMSIQTDSKEMGEALDPDSCLVFQLHSLFSNPNLEELRNQYKNGDIGYGGSKKQLFELVWAYFSEARRTREKLEKDHKLVDEILWNGAIKASEVANEKLMLVRERIGLVGNHLGS